MRDASYTKTINVIKYSKFTYTTIYHLTRIIEH